jgi:peptidoglycan/LPS O-acetylase OafA/YrhL/glycosyltransferase involved in cell wall biosynthesis
MRTTEDNNFTLLRLGLALMVVLGHFKAFVGDFSPAWPFSYAASAVECFFVVSGFLVTHSFDRDPDLKRFFVRRVCRIYPLYFAVIVAQTFILASLAPGGMAGNLGAMGSYLAANAVFANFANHDIGGVMTGLVDPSLNASLWTLKLEFAFYLILPFLWKGIQRWGLGLVAVLFAASVAYQQTLLALHEPTLAKQLPGQLHYFLLGILAYKYQHLFKFDRRIGLAVAVAAGVALTFLMHPHTPVIYPLVVATFVMTAALTTPRVRITRDISFGVYLVHAPLIQLSLLFGLYRPGWDGVAMIVGTALVLATIAERLIEVPGIVFGRRLAKRLSTPPKAPDPDGGLTVPAPDGALTVPAPDGALTVVVLNDFCHVQGGASKVAIDEAIGLANQGVNVIFVGAVGPICEQLSQAPLRVECLNQGQLLDAGKRPGVVLQGLWNTKASGRVRQILAGLSPNRTVVHLHGYTKALTTSPVRAAQSLGFKVVCTLHDFFAACPNGAFFDYGRAVPCPRRALSMGCVAARCDKRHYAHKLFRVARGYLQRVLGHFPAAVDHYISLSEKSAAILAPYLPKRAHMYKLANVIGVLESPPVAVEKNDRILYVGRLDEEKGVRLLARAAAALGLPVTFVGDGPLRAEIEAMPGITVTGWLAPEQVQSQLDSARCLVFPSLWYETYGLTVAEAAARGVPAIVSDVSAAAERIEDGVTGWCFKSGDAADLTRCLSLTADDTAIGRAGDEAYHRYWSDAQTLDSHATGLLTIYRSALA